MTWRRVPPVYSPVQPSALAGAAVAAAGLVSQNAAALERLLCTTFHASDALLTDSGTSALVLALQASAPGLPVAMPGYACIDLVAAAVRARVTVMLYDVDPETLSPAEDSVQAALRAGARALLVAPLYGYPPALGRLAELARDHGVPLIEDAAQAAGSMLESKRVGSFGDFTVLSFGRGKGTTAGSGGALLARGPLRSEAVRSARERLRRRRRGAKDVVMLAAQWTLARPLLYGIPSSIPMLKLGEMVYHPAPEPGALSAAGIALLGPALTHDAEEVRARRARAESLLAACASSRRVEPIRPLAGAEPGYLRLAVRDVTGSARAAPDLGVVRGYPITLDEHEVTRSVLSGPAPDLRGARVLRDRLLTLPTHSRTGVKDEARLHDWLAGDRTRLASAPAAV